MELEHWEPNQPFRPENITFRWRPGKHGSNDQRLEILNGDTWQPVSMIDVAFAFEHLAHNEERTHPSPQQGWLYWRRFLQLAYTNGWSACRTQMHQQRAQKVLQS